MIQCCVCFGRSCWIWYESRAANTGNLRNEQCFKRSPVWWPRVRTVGGAASLICNLIQYRYLRVKIS